MLLLTVIPMVKLSNFLQFINFIASEKSFVEISFKFSTVHYKMKKLTLFSSATYGQIYKLIWSASSLSSIAYSFLLSSRHIITHVVEGGRLIHFGAADIFTLISILQLKANKPQEHICTSELEVQTLSKAHPDTEQICT